MENNQLASPVLFARVGSMRFYAGTGPSDPRPVGGGSYNLTNLGHERFNFAKVNGRLYGYAKPRGQGPSLRRILPGASAEQIDGVLVVFIAGNHVVGWYRNAVVHSRSQQPIPALAPLRDNCPYFFEADAREAVLLPFPDRTCEVPRGVGGMGQANLSYAYQDDGTPRTTDWISRVLRWIRDYRGGNLLASFEDEVASDVEAAIEVAIGRAGAQGFASDSGTRAAIEKYAVKVARDHFASEGWTVTERGKPYDLECRKKDAVLYVEVKGTQSLGREILLTPGEVEWAKRHHIDMALFLVHSIVIRRTPKGPIATGGAPCIWHPWQPDSKALRAMGYLYRLPERQERAG